MTSAWSSESFLGLVRRTIKNPAMRARSSSVPAPPLLERSPALIPTRRLATTRLIARRRAASRDSSPMASRMPAIIDKLRARHRLAPERRQRDAQLAEHLAETRRPYLPELLQLARTRLPRLSPARRAWRSRQAPPWAGGRELSFRPLLSVEAGQQQIIIRRTPVIGWSVLPGVGRSNTTSAT
jgi:hypothetical protein